MPRFIADQTYTELFVAGSLDSLLGPESMVRVLWATLLEQDLAPFEAAYRNDAMGRPAVDPRRLVAVWILGLLRGVTSSVALAQRCACDLEWRWLLGGARVEKSTLAAFRTQHVAALQDLSTQLLAGLARAQMLPGTHAVVDGTLIQAAASCHANVSRTAQKARLKALHAQVGEALTAPDRDADALAALEARRDAVQLELDAMAALGLTEDDDRYTRTDPEATLKKLKTGAFAPAHNVQVVTDATSGAILAVFPVAQGNDQGLLAEGVAAAQAELARVAAKLTDAPDAVPGPLGTIAADGAYHDTRQVVALEAEGIAAVVPQGAAARQAPGVKPGFEAAAFTHDAATDTLTCPAGQPLAPVGLNEGQTAARYRAAASSCQGCPHKASCCPTATTQGRTVNRPLYTEELAMVAQRLDTPEGQSMIRARQVTAEGVFARLTEHLHWRRCRTWGMDGALAEGVWRQITHNLMLLTGLWQPLVALPAPGAA